MTDPDDLDLERLLPSPRASTRDFIREHKELMAHMRAIVAARRPKPRRQRRKIQVIDLSMLPAGTLSNRTIAAVLEVNRSTVQRLRSRLGIPPGQWTADNVKAAAAAPGRRRRSKRKPTP